MKTDGLGRKLVCVAESPQSDWQIEVYGPNKYGNHLYAYTKCKNRGKWSFPFGFPAKAEQIEFRWDLPNDAWGIFIEKRCWAICINRTALRLRQCRIHTRTHPYQKPFSEYNISYICAKKRFQKKGTHGGIIEA